MSARQVLVQFDGAGEHAMLTEFRDDLTLHENLPTVLDMARGFRFLPADCSVDELHVFLGDRRLNPQLRLPEQTEEIDALVIRRVPSHVHLRLRYRPDRVGDRSETLEVDPLEPLEPQIRAAVKGVLDAHVFRGRRRTRYRLLSEGKRLDVRSSLVAQGIEGDRTVSLEPVAVLGWPFRALEYVLLAILVASASAVLWYVLRPPERIEEFQVLLATDRDCRLLSLESPEPVPPLLVRKADPSGATPLHRGRYRFEVLPDGLPIFTVAVAIPGEATSRDTTRVALMIGDRFAGAGEIEIRVQGFWTGSDGEAAYSVDRRIRADLVVNGFHHRPGADGSVTLRVPRGEYDIRFAVDDERFAYVDVNGSRWAHSFRRDFTNYVNDHVQMSLYYERASAPGLEVSP